ncbi:MAG: flippase-like domain-containing protein [Actinobacteria bacterium]|nr:flippase-like domain-containing protein [Actinomycetota bacterium]
MLAARRRRLVRAGLLLAAAAVGYLAVPTLVDAGHQLHQLDRFDLGYLLLAIALQALSLHCYALLSRVFFVSRPPGLFTLDRIVLATTALGHVVPAGTAASAGLGVRLLTAEQISGSEAAAVLGAQALSSAVILNALLWLALVVCLPDIGLHPVFGAVVVVGVVLVLATGVLVLAFTRGREGTARHARDIGRRLGPFGPDRLEHVVHQISATIDHLTQDHRLLRRAIVWGGLNWLLDAVCLWCCLAAFGYLADPAALFAAYGIAYLLAAIPVTPAGLGVIEVTAVALLVGFGLPHGVATLGVLSWRLVNFWLPIPAGGLALVSLTARHARRHRDARTPVDGPDAVRALRVGPPPTPDPVERSSGTGSSEATAPGERTVCADDVGHAERTTVADVEARSAESA